MCKDSDMDTMDLIKAIRSGKINHPDDEGPKDESTDAGATSGIHISGNNKVEDATDGTDNDDILKDLKFKESMFIRKVNRMIKDFYEDDNMSNYQVPQVLDINDASLTKDGDLTLALTLQYEDNDTQDSVITIKKFSGKSGTYDLVPSKDIADVEAGGVEADVDVNPETESFRVTNLRYDVDLKANTSFNEEKNLKVQKIITVVGEV